MGHFSKRVASATMRSIWRFNVKKQFSIALTYSLIMIAFVVASFSAFGQTSASGQAPASEKQSARPADKQSEAPRQAGPGDLVAIIRTGAGMGALQQFTGDKRLLYAAIERVRWNPYGRVGSSPFQALAGGSPMRDARQGANAPSATGNGEPVAGESSDRF